MTDDDAFSLIDDTPPPAPGPAPPPTQPAFAGPGTSGMLAPPMSPVSYAIARSLRATLLLVTALGVAGCSVVPPSDADAGGGLNRTPGEPFIENICFQCTLRACNVALRACAREAGCSRWFDCVAACPTDDSGVAADGKCLQKCVVPVSAGVLFDCIQEFSTGSLQGCEQACAP